MTILSLQHEYCWLFIKNIYSSLSCAQRGYEVGPRSSRAGWLLLVCVFLWREGARVASSGVSSPPATARVLSLTKLYFLDSLALLPTKEFTWMPGKVCVCVCVCLLLFIECNNSAINIVLCVCIYFTDRLLFLASQSGMWWEQREICFFSFLTFLKIVVQI